MRLIRLEGLAQKGIEVRHARSLTGAIKLLKEDRATTLSGENGAINIWIDDSGLYRGKFMQWQITESKYKSSTLKALKGWLKEWIKEMH